MRRNILLFGNNKIVFRTFSEFKKNMEKNREEMDKYGQIFIKDKLIKLKKDKKWFNGTKKTT